MLFPCRSRRRNTHRSTHPPYGFTATRLIRKTYHQMALRGKYSYIHTQYMLRACTLSLPWVFFSVSTSILSEIKLFIRIHVHTHIYINTHTRRDIQCRRKSFRTSDPLIGFDLSPGGPLVGLSRGTVTLSST